MGCAWSDKFCLLSSMTIGAEQETLLNFCYYARLTGTTIRTNVERLFGGVTMMKFKSTRVLVITAVLTAE